MEKLVYSPKVQAYVETVGGTVNISNHIVSGSVTRVVDEVSTAELVLRNPGKAFTTPGSPTFRPMDKITIFASRFKNRPVQIFTGYLDRTPYLQLYPGTCTLAASCTLKRLLYTYWDPGLAHTQGFLKKYGWLPDISTGQVSSPHSKVQETEKNSDGKFTDGSVGNLMYAVLNEIGEWEEKDIHIEKFPDDAGKIVEGLVTNIAGNVDDAQKQFKKLMEDMVGDYNGLSGGGMVGPPSTGDDGGAAPTSGDISDAPEALQNFPRKSVYTQGELLSLLEAAEIPDPEYGAGIIFCESSGNIKADSGAGDPSGAGGDCCHGLWQLYLGNSPFDNTIFAPGPEGLAKAQDPIFSTWMASQYFANGGDWTPWDCATGAR